MGKHVAKENRRIASGVTAGDFYTVMKIVKQTRDAKPQPSE